MKQLLRRHGRNHRFVFEAGRLVPKGADPILPQEGIAVGPRIAYGSVNDDGTTANAGSDDWTITKAVSPAGVYLITFDPVFTALVAVNATVTNDDVLGDGPFIATLDPIRDNTSFTVRVWTIDNDPSPWDGPFDFIAVGT